MFFMSYFDDIRRISEYLAGKHGMFRPLNVLVSGHDLKFMVPYFELFDNDPRFCLRVEEHTGHKLDDEMTARQNLMWADVVFCEWALGNAVWYSNNVEARHLLVVRLHLQEWQQRDVIPYVREIDWDRVDRLFVTSHHVYEEMMESFVSLRGARACVFNCPIDCGTFDRRGESRSTKRLGLVGIVPQRKRLDLAIEILGKLQRVDPSFELIIKSRRPEEYPWMLKRDDEMRWFSKTFAMAESLPRPEGLIFESHGSNMPEWFAKIGFLLSTSDFEGTHQSVAEAMASGAIPIVRNWNGANRIYPRERVWRSVDEAVEMILALENEESFSKASMQSREFARQEFDKTRLCELMKSYVLGEMSRKHQILLNDNESTIVLSAWPRVLVVAYIAPGYRSGYRIRIEQEIRCLQKCGVHVELACLVPSDASVELIEPHKEELKAMGCPIHIIPISGFFSLDSSSDSYERVLDQLESIVKASHLRVVHSEALYCTRIALMLKKRVPSTRVLFDVHGATPEESAMGGASVSRIDGSARLEKMALQESDACSFVSNEMEIHFKAKYGFSVERRTLVPCCVTEAQFCSVDNDKLCLGLPDDCCVVGYVGSMAVWQCGSEMLRFCSELSVRENKVHFLFVVPECEHDVVCGFAARWGLSENRYTLVSLSHGDVPYALSRCDIGLLFRRKDPVNRVSSPTKFGEYLAAGTPVVMTDGVGDFSSLVEPNRIGLLVSDSVTSENGGLETDFQIVLDYLRDVDLDRNSFRRRCQDFASAHLHWDRSAVSLVDMYRSLIIGE